MFQLVTAISTGIASFIATNIDDIFILTLFFSQVNGIFRRRHIVVGQYLGFGLLLMASLSGFFGSLIVPPASIRYLGLVPIAIGIGFVLQPEEEDSTSVEVTEENLNPSPFANWLSPQTYSVAAVTVANGSDNIGVYVPLFANSRLESLLVILSVFLILVGVWCYAAYKLTTLPAIAQLLTGYGNTFVPCVLIGLGVFIVKESIVLSLVALGASYLWLITLGKNYQQESEIEK
jgi:cadmium resistance transport/sequestration family protein